MQLMARDPSTAAAWPGAGTLLLRRCVQGAIALAALGAGMAHAESTNVTGAGAAAARVNFSVVINHRLFLGVGTGAVTNPLGTNATIDTVAFNYTGNPLAVGTGAAASSITGASVNVRVYGNNGQITLTVSNPPNLVSGSNTIPFSQITVTSNSFWLPAPAMNGGAVFPWRDLFGLLRTTNRSAVWTFNYANTVAPPSGTYTGQVTYTASML